ncbi:MAG: alpha/beta hydrolase [Anaerolineales bacterium]|nr:alpha/beta hydrolase [Anaerolineales bacterium]
MSALIIDDEIVHYEVLGRGRPLIFVHGWVGSWRYWIPTMQAASISYRAYALDLWGFGETSKAQSRYSIDHYVTLLDRFLEEMGIAKIALVGHGLGAIVALMYANKFPRFVDRLMIVGFPMSKSNLNTRLQTEAPLDLEKWLLAGATIPEIARLEAAKTDNKAIVNTISNLDKIDLNQLATNLTHPCLVVHGQNDQAITMPNGETRLHDLSHTIIFEESGHYPMLTETNKFNRLLSDFLALESGQSPSELQIKEEWKRRVR